MADDTRGKDGGSRSAEEAALSARLRRLGERLDRAAAGRPSENGSGARPSGDASALARAMRLSAELVAGVIVGAGLGWLIDRGLGTSPFGLIVFLLLGFTAGVFNVVRSAGAGPGSQGRGGKD